MSTDRHACTTPLRPNSYVGSAVERIEDLRFLRGRGEYVDDITRPGLLHAVILRSPIAHGHIRGIDAAAALARSGVRAVITATEIGTVPTIPLRQEQLPAFRPFEQPVIASGKVRYVGEPVAVVIAASAAAAEDAAEAVVLDLEELPATADRAAAGRGARLFETATSHVAGSLTAIKGDADAAFHAAPYVRREAFTVQRHTAVPMEPRGLLAEWRDGRLTVYGAAKVAFPNRRILARQLGVAEDMIRMVENDVGGGFGVRGEFYPEDFLIPFAARFTAAPVKWIEDRREHLLATNHARAAACELEIACAPDGTILGLRGHAEMDIGAYIRTNGATAARNTAQVLSGPYRVPAIRMVASLILTNKTPVGTYRGPGRFEADFFRERLFDMAAGDLGIDRVEFRRKNLLSEAEMPAAFAKVAELDLETATDSGAYCSTFERCLREIDWAGKAALQGALIEGRYHGVAVGCYVEGGASGPKETARLVLERDGSVAVHVGSSANGQGLETAFAQIAADALELPIGSIAGVFHGSTDDVAEGFGTYSSRSTVMGGSAIMAAALGLREALRAAAARRLGCHDNEIILAADAARTAAGAAVALADLAADGIAAEGSYASPHRTYSYGAHAAYVAIDPVTGAVEVLDYVAVEDVGRIVNPAMLHGQAIGAIVQGLGGVFLEHLVYDDQGQLLTGSLADYLMPTACDFPSIRAVALEEKPAPHNPLGAKGAGEGGIIPVGGVIANAIAAALAPFGVEPRDLPLTPERLWALIAAAPKRPPSAAASARRSIRRG